MTLAFIIRLIKGQALFDEKAEERGEEERESEREGEAQAKSPLLGENGICMYVYMYYVPE